MIGLLISDQEYAISLTQAGTLLANGGPSFAYKPSTNPAAPQTLRVQMINQGGTATTLGTTSISTAGSVTPPTYSNTLLPARDSVSLTNQATADATFANWSFGLQFQKT